MEYLSSCYNDGVEYLIFSSPTNYFYPIGARFGLFFYLSNTIVLVPQTRASGNAKCSFRMWYYVHNWPSLSHRIIQWEIVSFSFFINTSSFNYSQNYFSCPFFHLFPLSLWLLLSPLLSLQWTSWTEIVFTILPGF